MPSSIVLVGGGVAAVTAAQELRGRGYDGRLTLVSKEREYPYDRTALSKAMLVGDISDPPLLMPGPRYDELRMMTVLDRAAVDLDARDKVVVLEGGVRLSADRILLATGARPRVPQVPGAGLAGVTTLRTSDEARWIRRTWQAGQHLVVVGGGLIGCEVATTARKLGLEVTIIEASDELLQRVVGRHIGAWARERLQGLGVEVRLRTGVTGFSGGDRISAVRSTDGQRIRADHAIICIGADPDTALAEQAGLACDRGIIVDATGRASAEGIFAAGDVASWPLRTGGRRCLETYLNSQKQAVAAAAAMLGQAAPAPQVPLSWTEVAGHYLQMIGDIDASDELVVRGSLDDGSALLLGLAGGRVAAAVSVESRREFAQAVRLVERGVEVGRDELGDPEVALKDLVKRAARETIPAR